jgi:hypothetical protein
LLAVNIMNIVNVPERFETCFVSAAECEEANGKTPKLQNELFISFRLKCLHLLDHARLKAAKDAPRGDASPPYATLV